MSFANWKKKSYLYNLCKDRAELEGIGYEDACHAAYRAGERQGRKDVEALAIRVIELRELLGGCQGKSK